MLPITRATLQSFCRVCLRELPENAASTREPNHNINEDHLFKVLQSISGVTMRSGSLYPQLICHSCYVKTNAFLKFREKAIVGTGILKLLVAETLQDAALVKLKYYCRVCLRKGNGPNDNIYTTEKNGEVHTCALECTGLNLAVDDDDAVDALSDDVRFPSKMCARCYATLKNFKEFRAVSLQTKTYLKGILDGVEDSEEPKNGQDITNAADSDREKDSDKLLEHEIVVEQLPICNSVKSEQNALDDGEMGVDYDYEMPIEVQMNIDEGEGIDLDAVDIKKEFDSDSDIDKTTTSKNSKKSKRKKVPKSEDEYKIWDSHTSESLSNDDDDSEYEGNKRRKKTPNKNKKSKATPEKADSIVSSGPNTRNSVKAKAAQSQTSTNDTKIKSDAEEENSNVDTANKVKTKNFSCDECDRHFYKKYIYDAHIKAVHEGVDKPFGCAFCEECFRSVQLLHRHVNIKHANEHLSHNPEDYPYSLSNTISQSLHFCLYCQRQFRRKDHLNEHIRAVHKGLRPFKCSICDKTFGSRNTQLRHEKNHSGIRPFACEFCGKRYNSESELKVHLQRHTTSPDLLCPICKRGKSSAEELQKHIAMHEASRQHQCTKCGKIFTKLYHLREHDNAVHLKLRPYKCQHCNESFGIRKTLRTHQRRHDPDRPEYCSICNLYFKTKRSLVLHMKKLHPKDEDTEEEKEDTAAPASVV